MTEVIFILVILYGLYVIHSVVDFSPKKKKDSVKDEPTVKQQKKPATKKTTQVKNKAQVPAGSLRNPATGEIAKIASQYRMTRRWIKEALVTEGLLDKVYKTNEIDGAEQGKIDVALAKLEKMEKYH